jgi:hypothetical protein
MSNAAARRRPNKTLIRSLRLRLEVQTAELSTCTTAAMRRCVEESIADTWRQLWDALERAELAWGRADMRG